MVKINSTIGSLDVSENFTFLNGKSVYRVLQTYYMRGSPLIKIKFKSLKGNKVYIKTYRKISSCFIIRDHY